MIEKDWRGRLPFQGDLLECARDGGTSEKGHWVQARRQALYLCDVREEATSRAWGTSPLLWASPQAPPRGGGRSGSSGESGHCCGPQDFPFSPVAVSEPRRGSNHRSWLPGTISVHLSGFGVCCGSPGESLPVCSRARRSSFSFSWILACLLPQREKKKRSRMFGKICRSVEHFLHWCKRRGGQRGRGGRGRAGLRGRAPGRSPPPHVLLPEVGGVN